MAQFVSDNWLENVLINMQLTQELAVCSGLQKKIDQKGSKLRLESYDYQRYHGSAGVLWFQSGVYLFF